MRKKGATRLLYAIRTGCCPYMVLKKMSDIRLENFVTKLIEYSLHNGSKRPQWWPNYLQFVKPIGKLKAKIEGRKWGSTLRNVIISCSQFHKIQFMDDINTQNTTVKSIASQRCTRREDYWMYKCCSNNRGILTRKKEVNADTAASEKAPVPNFNSPVALSPVVKLFDITYSKQFVQSLPTPVVNLVDILKYPETVKKKRKKKKKCNFRKKNKYMRPVCRLSHVRLHDLFEKPKDVQCTKDEFLNYFSLNRCSMNILSTVISKPTPPRNLRNHNIPISSDLGRHLMQTTTILKNQSSWKTQRLEWYLKELPQVKNGQQYSVTYSENETLERAHNYTFPKRQNHQTRHSLKVYTQLKTCRPVCVWIERLNIDKYIDKYKHTS